MKRLASLDGLMTRKLATLALAFGLLLSGQIAHAGRVYTSSAPTTIEYAEFTPLDDEETLTYGEDSDVTDESYAPKSFLGRYGPFYVMGADTVQMVGVVDARTPSQFKAMVTAHPGLKTLVLKEVPGTEDDDANLALARLVRKQGMETRVPADGSVRSGGVELFLAGTKRLAEPGAELGVHSWQDEDGREAKDYPANAPIHLAYINYYKEMGFSPEKAQDFYAFTNKSPFSDIHYMSRDEIAQYQLTN